MNADRLYYAGDTDYSTAFWLRCDILPLRGPVVLADGEDANNSGVIVKHRLPLVAADIRTNIDVISDSYDAVHGIDGDALVRQQNILLMTVGLEWRVDELYGLHAVILSVKPLVQLRENPPRIAPRSSPAPPSGAGVGDADGPSGHGADDSDSESDEGDGGPETYPPLEFQGYLGCALGLLSCVCKFVQGLARIQFWFDKKKMAAAEACLMSAFRDLSKRSPEGSK